MFIAISGHISDGLKFYGPFDTYMQAMNWIKRQDDDNWQIADLNEI